MEKFKEKFSRCSECHSPIIKFDECNYAYGEKKGMCYQCFRKLTEGKEWHKESQDD